MRQTTDSLVHMLRDPNLSPRTSAAIMQEISRRGEARSLARISNRNRSDLAFIMGRTGVLTDGDYRASGAL